MESNPFLTCITFQQMHTHVRNYFQNIQSLRPIIGCSPYMSRLFTQFHLEPLTQISRVICQNVEGKRALSTIWTPRPISSFRFCFSCDPIALYPLHGGIYTVTQAWVLLHTHRVESCPLRDHRMLGYHLHASVVSHLRRIHHSPNTMHMSRTKAISHSSISRCIFKVFPNPLSLRWFYFFDYNLMMVCSRPAMILGLRLNGE